MLVGRMSASFFSKPHPSYKVMTIAAVTALNSRRGVSSQAIYTYIGHKYKVGYYYYVRMALTKLVADGTLARMSGTGTKGPFKLGKVVVPKKVKKPAPMKAAT